MKNQTLWARRQEERLRAERRRIWTRIKKTAARNNAAEHLCCRAARLR